MQVQASQIPGFYGAFFHGSVNWLADEDPLPSGSDVDVMIVLEGPVPPGKPGKLFYQGVIIEASYLPAEQIRSKDQVLGISHLAGAFRTDSLIADPSGHLRKIWVGASKDYARREWVARRCEHAMNKARSNLKGLNPVLPFHDQVMTWLFGNGVTTHVLLVAGLQNPTVRKRYLAVRELLAQYCRLDFYDTLLSMLGCQQLNQAQTRQHLATLTAAFDDAQAVIRTPFVFAADISQLGRPGAIDGSRELIERGDHREAIFWIAVTYSRCQKVLAQDGPPGMIEQHNPGYRALLADLGIGSFIDIQERSQQALNILPTVWEVAQAIMASNPEIID